MYIGFEPRQRHSPNPAYYKGSNYKAYASPLPHSTSKATKTPQKYRNTSLKYLNKLPPKTPDTSAKKEYSPHNNLTCTADREKRLLTELREKERELGDSRRKCEEMRDSSNRLKVSVSEWKEKYKGLEDRNRALERSLAQRQRQWLQSQNNLKHQLDTLKYKYKQLQTKYNAYESPKRVTIAKDKQPIKKCHQCADKDRTIANLKTLKTRLEKDIEEIQKNQMRRLSEERKKKSIQRKSGQRRYKYLEDQSSLVESIKRNQPKISHNVSIQMLKLKYQKQILEKQLKKIKEDFEFMRDLNTRLRKQINEQKSEKKPGKRETDEQKDPFEDPKRETKVLEIQKNFLKKDIESLQAQKKSIENEIKLMKTSDKQKQLKQLNQLQSLTKERDNLQAKLTKVSQQLNGQIVKIKDMEDYYLSKISSYEAQNKNFRVINDKLGKALQETKHMLIDQEEKQIQLERLRAVERQLTNQKLTNNQLIKKLKKQENQVKSSQELVAKKTQQAEKLQQKLKNLLTTQQNFDNILEKKDADIILLEKNLFKARKDLQIQQKIIQNQQKLIKQLKAKIADLQSQLSRIVQLQKQLISSRKNTQKEQFSDSLQLAHQALEQQKANFQQVKAEFEVVCSTIKYQQDQKENELEQRMRKIQQAYSHLELERAKLSQMKDNQYRELENMAYQVSKQKDEVIEMQTKLQEQKILFQQEKKLQKLKQAQAKMESPQKHPESPRNFQEQVKTLRNQYDILIDEKFVSDTNLQTERSKVIALQNQLKAKDARLNNLSEQVTNANILNQKLKKQHQKEKIQTQNELRLAFQSLQMKVGITFENLQRRQLGKITDYIQAQQQKLNYLNEQISKLEQKVHNSGSHDGCKQDLQQAYDNLQLILEKYKKQKLIEEEISKDIKVLELQWENKIQGCQRALLVLNDLKNTVTNLPQSIAQGNQSKSINEINNALKIIEQSL